MRRDVSTTPATPRAVSGAGTGLEEDDRRHGKNNGLDRLWAMERHPLFLDDRARLALRVHRPPVQPPDHEGVERREGEDDRHGAGHHEREKGEIQALGDEDVLRIADRGERAPDVARAGQGQEIGERVPARGEERSRQEGRQGEAGHVVGEDG
jgi:hypothetical protein